MNCVGSDVRLEMIQDWLLPLERPDPLVSLGYYSNVEMIARSM